MDIFLDIVMSAIGLGYFIYGKKIASFNFLIFGLIIMLYIFFVKDLLLSIIIGILLLIAPFFIQKFSK